MYFLPYYLFAFSSQKWRKRIRGLQAKDHGMTVQVFLLLKSAKKVSSVVSYSHEASWKEIQVSGIKGRDRNQPRKYQAYLLNFQSSFKYKSNSLLGYFCFSENLK